MIKLSCWSSTNLVAVERTRKGKKLKHMFNFSLRFWIAYESQMQLYLLSKYMIFCHPLCHCHIYHPNHPDQCLQVFLFVTGFYKCFHHQDPNDNHHHRPHNDDDRHHRSPHHDHCPQVVRSWVDPINLLWPPVLPPSLSCSSYLTG